MSLSTSPTKPPAPTEAEIEKDFEISFPAPSSPPSKASSSPTANTEETKSKPKSRKPGVSLPSELASFIAAAGSDKIIVIDVRSNREADDKASILQDPLAESVLDDPTNPALLFRPRSINIPWKRDLRSMDSSFIPKSWVDECGGIENVSIITHCGGGGRGDKSKQFLKTLGFANVLNGGGPQDSGCWEVFGKL